jgi:hypothetical protein
MIPLFGKLAFLLPDLDLTLVMISPVAKKICEKAIKFPNSIVSKGRTECNSIIVYDFNPSGFGRVRIGVQPSIDFFHEWEEHYKCDGAIALNAGLGTYQTRDHALIFLVRANIPFATSDHTIGIVDRSLKF